MTCIEHKQCCGAMFPNPLHATNDRINAGMALTYVVISPGDDPGTTQRRGKSRRGGRLHAVPGV
jgi:hypothetical protein